MTPIDVLLRALGDFLRDEVQSDLTGYTAYQNRIATNLLALLEREARHGEVLAKLDASCLQALGLDADAAVTNLARALRDGAQMDSDALRQYLRRRTLLRLSIDNPRYSGLAQARERWPELAAELDEAIAADSRSRS